MTQTSSAHLEPQQLPGTAIQQAAPEGPAAPAVGWTIRTGPYPPSTQHSSTRPHGSELIHSVAQLAKYRLILDRMQKAALEPGASRDLIHRRN
ncbi:Scr1 family TA system antitoxin-like transcriptional regulator [Streptomyces blattellae]|uniref:Scr1 family TA system antitoxin-like transcriptional regulator n=1 Tax=Streptomyces blattellae TaxID=2569855 RepID=UPI0018ACD93D|nr:Scr1 family TA system antitoxin-like transcriptional regulator [Streptomyces blattellae]